MTAKNSYRAKKRRRNGQRTWDGVPDEEIFMRDEWRCQMPVCLCPEGRRISRLLRGAEGDPWRPSIDHITRLADGGQDTAENKRAAHARCNEAAAPSPASQRALDLTVGARLPAAVLAQLSEWVPS